MYVSLAYCLLYSMSAAVDQTVTLIICSRLFYFESIYYIENSDVLLNYNSVEILTLILTFTYFARLLK